MNDKPLPPELQDLEALLASRPAQEPPPGLRDRVLAAAAQQPAPSRWPKRLRAFAAILLGLNLASSAANGLRYHRLAETTSPPVERRAAAPGEESEDRLDAFAASALSNLTPAPDVGGLGRNFFNEMGVRPWATP